MGILRRIVALLAGRRMDRELDEEIAAHLALQEQEFRRAGMSPREAREAALREFGGVTQTVERYRERRGIPWLANAAKDLRYAVRGLLHNRGFAAAAIL